MIVHQIVEHQNVESLIQYCHNGNFAELNLKSKQTLGEKSFIPVKQIRLTTEPTKAK